MPVRENAMANLDVMNVLASRGRTLQALYDGDPVAWTILVVVVVVGAIAWALVKKRRNR